MSETRLDQKEHSTITIISQVIYIYMIVCDVPLALKMINCYHGGAGITFKPGHVGPAFGLETIFLGTFKAERV